MTPKGQKMTKKVEKMSKAGENDLEKRLRNGKWQKQSHEMLALRDGHPLKEKKHEGGFAEHMGPPVLCVPHTLRIGPQAKTTCWTAGPMAVHCN